MDGPREWDATTYREVSVPHQGWGAEIVSRLPALRGDETFVDLGCGTGRLTAQLLELLPRGHVIGVDGSEAMLEQARELLPERTTFVRADLLELSLPSPVDGAVSSATFHWIADHDTLFARVRAVLRPGAPFVAQCGGRGNIASIRRAVDVVVMREPFAEFFAGWAGPWNFAGPEETTERLERAGFAVERCWLNDSPQYPADIRSFMATVSLGTHLDRLPAELRDPFIDAVVEELGPNPVQDYVRLNIVAVAR
jgi:trans-aconitate 2-methyltransferase